MKLKYILAFPRLQKYSVETAIAVIVDGSADLKINTQHLRDLSFRVDSIYQFIGELLLQTDNEVNGHPVLCLLHGTVLQHMKVAARALSVHIVSFQAVLQARVGRNVDGIDLNLYHQSLQLLYQFQANHMNKSSSWYASDFGKGSLSVFLRLSYSKLENREDRSVSSMVVE